MFTVDNERLWRLAVTTLTDNWQHDHTVPSRNLYPHQWSWDSGFIALGLARVAPERAWQDLRSLFSAQWDDGRVPHIVFNQENGGREYFPGAKFWRSSDVAGAPERATSGIVQPPIHALAAWRIYCQATDPDACRAALLELTWLYPRLVDQQRYLAEQRDVGGGGLACLVHPWESGLDNSPAWDEALAAVPSDPEFLPRHRRDLAVSVASHRPTDTDYARYIALAQSYRDQGYQDKLLTEQHKFLIECPTFNAIFGLAEHVLAKIAEVVGADPAPHRARAAAITKALVERLYDPATGMFHARDLRTDRLNPKRCVSGLLPLMLPELPDEQVKGVLTEAASARFGLPETTKMPLPSYDRTAPDVDPLRYWRGPVWINVNWLLWRGLLGHGRTDLAATLRRSMIELVNRSGCFEYYHPADGDGIGAAEFSWTAALVLDLLSDDGCADQFPVW